MSDGVELIIAKPDKRYIGEHTRWHYRDKFVFLSQRIGVDLTVHEPLCIIVTSLKSGRAMQHVREHTGHAN